MGGKLTVADFFCGAGGFSEGFRQKGFKVVFALDHWQPAVDTHHLNHPEAKTVKMDILELDTPEKIDSMVPDTDVIIGSPPCVSFSGSNKAGKADKGLGIRLIEAYLRIVAWKMKKGILKNWVMENVPNSENYVKDSYTWKELGLPGKGPTLKITQKGVYNAAQFGAPQTRRRFVCGNFKDPVKTHENSDDWVTMEKVMGSLSSPDSKVKRVKDINYGFTISSDRLTDHFYDTRVPEFEWKKARRLKVDHGFMGKMSFPEKIDRPSRTVMATMSASTREAIIFKSGKGYRLPTIREIASFMSFPITYQFEAGNENNKYKLVGNAVCAKLSGAFAESIAKENNVDLPKSFIHLPNVKSSFDLTGTKRILKAPKDKRYSAKFAVHIPEIKVRNFRVDLSNKYSNFENDNIIWKAILHHGSGKGYVLYEPTNEELMHIESLMPNFSKDIKETFSSIHIDAKTLQDSYVLNENRNPEYYLQIMKDIIDKHYPENKFQNETIENNSILNIEKDKIPLRILAGVYACKTFVNNLESKNMNKSQLKKICVEC